MSIKMMDYLLESNDLWTLCKYQAGLTERDLVFIKEIILGHPISGDEFQGRPPNKHFLYQVLVNESRHLYSLHACICNSKTEHHLTFFCQ